MADSVEECRVWQIVCLENIDMHMGKKTTAKMSEKLKIQTKLCNLISLYVFSDLESSSLLGT